MAQSPQAPYITVQPNREGSDANDCQARPDLDVLLEIDGQQSGGLAAPVSLQRGEAFGQLK